MKSVALAIRWIEERYAVDDTMATALYIHSLYPNLTIKEVFERLDDVEFLEKMIELLEVSYDA